MVPDESEARTGWQCFDHTADVGLEVWATDMHGLLEEAAQAVAATMFDQDSVAEEREHEFAVEAEEPEELLVAWLDEILYAFDAEHFVTARAVVNRLDDGVVAGILVGQTYDPARHEQLVSVKAVTYHDLQIEETDRGLEVRIVLDV